MSPKGRPKGECRSAKREGISIRPAESSLRANTGVRSAKEAR